MLTKRKTAVVDAILSVVQELRQSCSCNAREKSGWRDH